MTTHPAEAAATPPRAPVITLVRPDRISHAGATVVVGTRAYTALASLAVRGRLPRPEFGFLVWGRQPSNSCLWSMLHRINRKLAGVGYPLRAYLDGDLVVFG